MTVTLPVWLVSELLVSVTSVKFPAVTVVGDTPTTKLPGSWPAFGKAKPQENFGSAQRGSRLIWWLTQTMRAKLGR